MRFEKSCGSIIYRLEKKQILFLVVRYKNHSQYWGLVKGHVEKNESEYDTARREIYEEVGLRSLMFVPGFRETVFYSPYNDCVKEVVFFLAKTNEKKIQFLFQEHDQSKWLPGEKALSYLKHGNDRYVLQRANVFVDSLQNT